MNISKRLSLIFVTGALVACGAGEQKVTHGGEVEIATTQNTGSNSQSDMVAWLASPAAKTAKAEESEKEKRRNFGRGEPEPEFLQPRLDAELKKYIPRSDLVLSGSFYGTSSDILPRLVERWIVAFQAYYPDVDISLKTPYAGSLGMLEVIKGDLDFVFVSRELKPTDLVSFEKKYGYQPFTVEVVGGVYRHFGFLDAIGFFVNKDNPLDKISLDELDALLSTTRHRGGKAIRTWGDLGLTGEWKDKQVVVEGITPWNGFEEFVRQKVLNVENSHGEWRRDLNFSKLAFDPAALVAKNKYAIGYTGLAYVDSPVKVLPLSQHKGGEYISPSYENVAMFNYPLSRTIYFATNKKPNKQLDPAMNEFLKFILSKDGQAIVRDHEIFLPLRAKKVAEGRNKLK